MLLFSCRRWTVWPDGSIFLTVWATFFNPFASLHYGKIQIVLRLYNAVTVWVVFHSFWATFHKLWRFLAKQSDHTGDEGSYRPNSQACSNAATGRLLTFFVVNVNHCLGRHEPSPPLLKNSMVKLIVQACGECRNHWHQRAHRGLDRSVSKVEYLPG